MTLKSICPSCGEPSDGICERCLAQDRNIAAVPGVLTIKICPMCSDHFFRGHWRDEDLDHAITRVVEEALTIDADEATVKVILNEVTPTMVRARVEVDVPHLGETQHKSYDVDVRVDRATCDRCCRVSGGYYESKVQIRADRRMPDESELHRAVEIVTRTIESAQKADRLAFIAKTIQLREGLDLYVGTVKAAKRIVRALVREMGGSFSDSAKLVGRRDGKDIYRVTFVVRLPEFPTGAIISAKQHIYEICSITSATNAVDLETGQSAALKVEDLRNAQLLGARSDAKRTVLVSIDADEAHLLDPETYVTLAIKRPAYVCKDDEGREIQVVKTREGVFILP
ncbi:MAG: NMD3-related protein [Halobacteriota archaeon]